MHLFRTQFGQDIIGEFLPPANNHKYAPLIILCDGLPSMPHKKSLIHHLSHENYFVIHPRYRGTWESGGILFHEPPHNDISIILDSLKTGITNTYTQETHHIIPTDIIIAGASFGGAVALLASLDNRITQCIALSPLIDWTYPNELFSINDEYRFIQTAFNHAYRYDADVIEKLSSGIFFNPVHHINELQGEKIHIIATENDPITPLPPIHFFAQSIKAQLTTIKKGGHLSLHTLTQYL
jgi:pimeloyl-ACP methyl ester carboxylesterase